MLVLLWDSSDIWGPLALWGVRGLGLPCRVASAEEIANGLLTREGATALLVPGGFGRHKAQALGDAGLDAVRAFVRRGGSYIGFCGGAGLALADEHGLGLCPWGRAGYANRMQHYMSGHWHATVATDPLVPDQFPASALLPVWWPGRFAPVVKKDAPVFFSEKGVTAAASAEDVTAFVSEEDVTVLATYATPGPDFWLADLPVASLPLSLFADWEEKYAIAASPSFLSGEPCVIRGRYGKGTYLLSYTHLETPASPEANAWLAHLFEALGAGRPARTLVPAWDLEALPSVWEDAALARMRDDLRHILDAGIAAGLFFVRSPWLLGWRTGTPGAVLNTIRAHLHTALSLPPSPAALAYWGEHKAALVPAFHHFAERAQSYLLAERLAMTLAKDLPDALAPKSLLAERTAVFGASGMAAHAGGLLEPLLPLLERLALAQVRCL